MQARTHDVVQLLRFGVVGVVSNVTLYLGYLLLTSLGLAAPVAMTVTFVCGVLASFAVNSAWTFRQSVARRLVLLRYAACYGGCYLLNLFMLQLGTVVLGFDHRLVQAVAIVVIGLCLFVLLRVFAFGTPAGAKP